MRYLNGGDSPRIGLVGKGIVYDSGGYSIKTTPGMKNMFDDMGGAAAVIGAMTAVADQKLKANVIGVIAACENKIAADAYVPGDIIGSMSGKTIEVISAADSSPTLPPLPAAQKPPSANTAPPC